MGTKEAKAGGGSWHEETRGQRDQGLRQESGGRNRPTGRVWDDKVKGSKARRRVSVAAEF